jgi:Bacterial protein of unknown function (DUF899)
VYGHLLEGDKRAAAESMSRLCSGLTCARGSQRGSQSNKKARCRAGNGPMSWARSEGLEPQPSDASMFVKDLREDSSTGELPVELAGDVSLETAADFPGGLSLGGKPPLERILTFARERGWRHLRLLSSAGTAYNRDYFAETAEGDQQPTLNMFHRDGETIRHFCGCGPACAGRP